MSRIPAIDLNRHWFVRPFMDLLVWGTWLHNDQMEDYEPCLVITPLARSGYRPVCVALSSAFKYNDATYCHKAARLFVNDLGLEDNKENIHKVRDAIHSHLGDLVSMPENPTVRQVGAEARVTIGGKTQTLEIFDHLPMPQA